MFKPNSRFLRLSPLFVACIAAVSNVQAIPTPPAELNVELPPPSWKVNQDKTEITAQTDFAMSSLKNLRIAVNKYKKLMLDVDTKVGDVPLAIQYPEIKVALVPSIEAEDLFPEAFKNTYFIEVGKNREFQLDVGDRRVTLDSKTTGLVFLDQEAQAGFRMKEFRKGGEKSSFQEPTTALWDDVPSVTLEKGKLTKLNGKPEWLPDTFVLKDEANLVFDGEVLLNDAGTFYLANPDGEAKGATFTVNKKATLNFDTGNFVNVSSWVGSDFADLDFRGGLDINGAVKADNIVQLSIKDKTFQIVDFAGLRATNLATVSVKDHFSMKSYTAGKSYGIHTKNDAQVTLENADLTVVGSEVTGILAEDNSIVRLEGDKVRLSVEAKALSKKSPKVNGATGVEVRSNAAVYWDTGLQKDQVLDVLAHQGQAFGLRLQENGLFESAAHNFHLNAASMSDVATAIHLRGISELDLASYNRLNIEARSAYKTATGLEAIDSSTVRVFGQDVKVLARVDDDKSDKTSHAYGIKNSSIDEFDFGAENSMAIEALAGKGSAVGYVQTGTGVAILGTDPESVGSNKTFHVTAKGEQQALALAVHAGTLEVISDTMNLSATSKVSAIGIDLQSKEDQLPSDLFLRAKDKIHLTSFGGEAKAIAVQSSELTVETSSMMATAKGKEDAVALLIEGRKHGVANVRITATNELALSATGQNAFGLSKLHSGHTILTGDKLSIEAGDVGTAEGYGVVVTGGKLTLTGSSDGVIKAHAKHKAFGIRAKKGHLVYSGSNLTISSTAERRNLDNALGLEAVGLDVAEANVELTPGKLHVVSEVIGKKGLAIGVKVTDGGELTGIEALSKVEFIAKAKEADASALTAMSSKEMELKGDDNYLIALRNSTEEKSATINFSKAKITIGGEDTKLNRVFALSYDAKGTNFEGKFDEYESTKRGYAIVGKNQATLKFVGGKTEIIGDVLLEDRSKIEFSDTDGPNRLFGNVNLRNGSELDFSSQTKEPNFIGFQGNVTAGGTGSKATLQLTGDKQNPMFLSGAFNDRFIKRPDGSISKESGEINVVLKDATWLMTDRSVISALRSPKGGAVVDMTKAGIKGLFIGELEWVENSSTIFEMTLDPENRQKSSRLYIGKNTKNVLINVSDIESLDLSSLLYLPLHIGSVQNGQPLTLQKMPMDTEYYEFKFEKDTALKGQLPYDGIFSKEEYNDLFKEKPVEHWVLKAKRKKDLLYKMVKEQIDKAKADLAKAETEEAKQKAQEELDKAWKLLPWSEVRNSDLDELEKRANENAQSITDMFGQLKTDVFKSIAENTKTIEENSRTLAILDMKLDGAQKTMEKTQETSAKNTVRLVALSDRIESTGLIKRADEVSTQAKTLSEELLKQTALLKEQGEKISVHASALQALKAKSEARALVAGRLNDEATKTKKDLHEGLAMQAALSGLFKPYNVGRFNVSVAVGGYKSETALALGSGFRFNKRYAVTLGAASNVKHTRNVTANVGLEVTF